MVEADRRSGSSFPLFFQQATAETSRRGRAERREGLIKEGTLYAYSHSSLIVNVVIDNDDDDDEDDSGQHECISQHWVTEHAYMSVGLQVKAGSPEHEDTLLHCKSTAVNILMLIIIMKKI